jgi:RNA polymerase sigma-54 factor
MALGPRLDLRHTQSLVMTPQLRQAIKLLQLSNIEVNAFVEEELERNPLLERDERAEVEVERPALDQRPLGADGADAAALAGSGDLPSSDAAPLDAVHAEEYDPGGVAAGGGPLGGRGGGPGFAPDARGRGAPAPAASRAGAGSCR